MINILLWSIMDLVQNSTPIFDYPSCFNNPIWIRQNEFYLASSMAFIKA